MSAPHKDGWNEDIAFKRTDPVTPVPAGGPESRARRKIRLAVEAKGYTLTGLTWEPWGAPAEKEGIPGGWEGWVDPIPLNAPNGLAGRDGSDIFRIPDVMGLSVSEALEWIDQWLPAVSA